MALQVRELHAWELSPKEAIAVQEELRNQLILEDCFGDLKTVAGVDVGFENRGKTTRAAVTVHSYPDLVLQEHAIARLPTSFPYVPGLLSFREIPAVLDALQKLRTVPDMLLCDGQGYAHPRRFGLASHLGLVCDLPSVWVAKSRLIGEYKTPGLERGARQPLVDNGETIGMVLRTRADVKPVFVSIGHRVSLESAVKLVLDCAPKYRLPEPCRMAHHFASA